MYIALNLYEDLTEIIIIIICYIFASILYIANNLYKLIYHCYDYY